MTWTNRFGTQVCRVGQYHEPRNFVELQKIVRSAMIKGSRIRVVGGGHSSGTIVKLDGPQAHLVSLAFINRVVEIHPDRRIAKVEAGCTMYALHLELSKLGLALPIVPSGGNVTVGGALATGVHGCGTALRIFGSMVRELEVMTSDGSIVSCSRSENPDFFRCMIVNLGCLGIVLTATLQVESAFKLRYARQPLLLKDLPRRLPSLLEQSEYLKLCWIPHTPHCVCWSAVRVSQSSPSNSVANQNVFFSALRMLLRRILSKYVFELLVFLSAILPFRPWTRAVGPLINAFFYRMLYAARTEGLETGYRAFMEAMPAPQDVPYRATAWAIPVDSLESALSDLQALLRPQHQRPSDGSADDSSSSSSRGSLFMHLPVEISFVQKDDFPMSYAHDRDVAVLDVYSYLPFAAGSSSSSGSGSGRETVAARMREELFTRVQEIMLRLDGRPHWADDYPSSLPFSSMYREWSLFQKVKRQMDPQNMFSNALLDEVFSSPVPLAAAAQPLG